jgi:hypothetical protein
MLEKMIITMGGDASEHTGLQKLTRRAARGHSEQRGRCRCRPRWPPSRCRGIRASDRRNKLPGDGGGAGFRLKPHWENCGKSKRHIHIPVICSVVMCTSRAKASERKENGIASGKMANRVRFRFASRIGKRGQNGDYAWMPLIDDQVRRRLNSGGTVASEQNQSCSFFLSNVQDGETHEIPTYRPCDHVGPRSTH